MGKNGILTGLLFAVIIFLCGCGAKEKSNHICIECGRAATNYMGKQVVNYTVVELYYCDACYEKVIKDAEDNHRIMDFSPKM